MRGGYVGIMVGAVLELFYFMGYRGGLYGLLLSKLHERWWINTGYYGGMLNRHGYGSLSFRDVGFSLYMGRDLGWCAVHAGYFWAFDDELLDMLCVLGGHMEYFDEGRLGVRFSFELASALFSAGLFCWCGEGVSFRFELGDLFCFELGDSTKLKGYFSDGVVSDLCYLSRERNYVSLGGLDSLVDKGLGDIVNVQVLRGVMGYLNM